MISLWAGLVFSFGLFFGVVIGALLEFNNSERKIRVAYREQEELRSVIYALNHKRPHPPRNV